MTTQKTKTDTKQNDKFKKLAIPALIVASIALNVISIGAFIAAKTGILDYAIVNNGYNVKCSESYREKVVANDSSNSVAYVDYECQRGDDASRYYLQGYNDYLKSQGISQE